MTSYEFGAVVLVPFPYTDQTASKKRPAVVVSSAAYQQERLDLVVMPVTSQPQKSMRLGDADRQARRRGGIGRRHQELLDVSSAEEAGGQGLGDRAGYGGAPVLRHQLHQARQVGVAAPAIGQEPVEEGPPLRA